MTHNKSIRQEVIELETYKSNYIQKNYVEGKVIIITGASSGFGKLTAKRAAEMGGKIVLAARSEEKLKETVAEIKAAGGEASYIVTDVAKKDDVFAMAKFAVDTYGRIDVLVNNAGTMPLAFSVSMSRRWTNGNSASTSASRALFSASPPSMTR